MDLEQLKQKVKSVVQNDNCGMTVMAWTVAVYWSLYRAKRLGHTEDCFRKLHLDEARQALLKVLELMDQEEPLEGDPKLWMSGHYYNNAILRMHALVEQGLKNLWERVNNGSQMAIQSKIVGDYRFSNLLSWYREVFSASGEELGNLNKEVNELKHEYRTTPLEKLKMPQALIAFDQTLELLLKTFDDPLNLTALQEKSEWYKKQIADKLTKG